MRKFERFCHHKKKNAVNTTRKELGRVRRVLRQAEKHGRIDKNPFRLYDLPKRQEPNRRKLTFETIGKLKELDLDGYTALARDVFVFAFYAHGMRFGDVCCLRRENVRDGRFEYTMMKTGRRVRGKLPTPAQAIAERYRSESPYVFPFLEKGDEIDGVHLRRRINSNNVMVNEALKDVAKAAEIKAEGFSMHVARHSYGTSHAGRAAICTQSWRASGIRRSRSRSSTSSPWTRTPPTNSTINSGAMRRISNFREYEELTWFQYGELNYSDDVGHIVDELREKCEEAQKIWDRSPAEFKAELERASGTWQRVLLYMNTLQKVPLNVRLRYDAEWPEEWGQSELMKGERGRPKSDFTPSDEEMREWLDTNLDVSRHRPSRSTSRRLTISNTLRDDVADEFNISQSQARNIILRLFDRGDFSPPLDYMHL